MPKGKTRRRDEARTGTERVLARTRNRLDDGNKGNRRARSPTKAPERKSCWPNELKLSDGGRKSKELGTDATPPFAGATLLGLRRSCVEERRSSQSASGSTCNYVGRHEPDETDDGA